MQASWKDSVKILLDPRRLRSNDAASTDEADAIRKILCQVEIALCDLTQVSRTQPLTEEMKKEKKKLLKTITKHRRLLSSVLRIPQEIWMDIFDIILFPPEMEASTLHWIDAFFDPKHPLIKLSQVCQGWRRILHSQPRFWTRIFISTDSPVWEKTRRTIEDNAGALQAQFLSRRVEHLSNILANTQSHPLQIRVACREARRADAIQAAVRTLAQHHQRWAGLDIIDNQSLCAINSLLSCIENQEINQFSSLEKLKLISWLGGYNNPADSTDVLVDLCRLSGRLPRLRAVTFANVFPTGSGIPWPQLTYAAFIGIHDFSHLLSVLPSLRSLVELEVSFLALPFDEPVAAVEPHVFSALERLKVAYLWETRIFSCVHAPNLRHIQLKELSYDASQEVFDFLTQSRCQLDTLSIDSSIHVLNGNRFCDILRYTARLRKLHVYEGSYEVDRLMTMLQCLGEVNHNGKLVLCPTLEEIDIQVWFFTTNMPLLKAAVDMFEARWAYRLAADNRDMGLRVVGTVPVYINARATDDPRGDRRKQYERLEALSRDGLRVIFGSFTRSI